MRKALLVIMAILFTGTGSFAEGAVREYREEKLQEAYEYFEVKDALPLEKIEAQLEVLIADEYMYGSACVDDDLYVLTTKGIYAIDLEGGSVFYPYATTPSERVEYARQLFDVNGELWALMFSRDDPESATVTACYYAIVRLSEEEGLAFTRQTKVDTGIFYSDAEIGKRVGGQYYPVIQDGQVYCIDYVENLAMGNLLRFSIQNGMGEDLGTLPGVCCMVSYKPGKLLALHESMIQLQQGDFDIVSDASPVDALVKPLTLIDVNAGTVEIVHIFDDSRYAETNGGASSLAYDHESDTLYYTMYGKVHRVVGLDFDTDTVVAEAPANWLFTLGCGVGNSYVMRNGYYMHVVPSTGVDIIRVTGE